MKITDLEEKTTLTDNSLLVVDDGISTDSIKAINAKTYFSPPEKYGTLTLPHSSGWIDMGYGAYCRSVLFEGASSLSHPIVDLLIVGDDLPNIDDIYDSWSKIFRVTMSNTSVLFYATEIPTIDLVVQVKGY